MVSDACRIAPHRAQVISAVFPASVQVASFATLVTDLTCSSAGISSVKLSPSCTVQV